jgi:hypothetical protein
VDILLLVVSLLLATNGTLVATFVGCMEKSATERVLYAQNARYRESYAPIQAIYPLAKDGLTMSISPQRDLGDQAKEANLEGMATAAAVMPKGSLVNPTMDRFPKVRDHSHKASRSLKDIPSLVIARGNKKKN